MYWRGSHLREVLQLAGKDEHIGRRSVHLEQRIVCNVEVDLARMRLRRWKDRIKATLTEHMPYKASHGVFDLLILQFLVGLGFFGALDELFAPQMKENVNGGNCDDHLVEGKGARVRQRFDPLMMVVSKL